MSEEAPDVIYLLPGDEQGSWVWCDDPSPGIYDDPDEAIKYIKSSAQRNKILDEAIEEVEEYYRYKYTSKPISKEYLELIKAIRGLKND